MSKLGKTYSPRFLARVRKQPAEHSSSRPGMVWNPGGRGWVFLDARRHQPLLPGVTSTRLMALRREEDKRRRLEDKKAFKQALQMKSSTWRLRTHYPLGEKTIKDLLELRARGLAPQPKVALFPSALHSLLARHAARRAAQEEPVGPVPMYVPPKPVEPVGPEVCTADYRFMLSMNQLRTLFGKRRIMQFVSEPAGTKGPSDLYARKACGAFACAFKGRNVQRVVKFTGDESDALAMNAVHYEWPEGHPNVVKPFKIWRLMGNKDSGGDFIPSQLFAIEAERLKTWPRTHKVRAWQNNANPHCLNMSGRKQLTAGDIAKIASGLVKHGGPVAWYRRYLTDMQGALYALLTSAGIEWTDTHGGNVGKKSKSAGGHWAALDLGVSTSSKLYPPIEELAGAAGRAWAKRAIVGGIVVLGLGLALRSDSAPPFGIRAPLDRQRRRFLKAIESVLGWRYVWGGESFEEGGFDCSGLISWAAIEAGIKPAGWRPTASGLGRAFQQVSQADARPGDLILYGTPARHVAIKLEGDQAVSALGRAYGVTTHRLAFSTPSAFLRLT